MKTPKVLLAYAVIAIAFWQWNDSYAIKPLDVVYAHTLMAYDRKQFEQDYDLVFRPYVDENRLSEEYYFEEWESRLDVDPTVESKYELARFIRALKPELAKNPPTVLKNDLDTLFFVTVIFHSIKPYGGTYHAEDNAVFIRSRGEAELNAGYFFQYALHHEFSSILMKKYGFDKSKWRAVYPDKFIYGGEEYFGYYHMMLTGDVPVMSEQELHERALLSQYSETSVENDFNTYAEYVFTRPEQLKQLIAEYPIIKRKYEVFKEFYLSIDGGFQPVFDKIEEK